MRTPSSTDRLTTIDDLSSTARTTLKTFIHMTCINSKVIELEKTGHNKLEKYRFNIDLFSSSKTIKGFQTKN